MMLKILLFSFFLLGYLSALNISHKYPNSEQVLKELDINQNYINNYEFKQFVYKNEAKFRRFYTNSTQRGKRIIPVFDDLLAKSGLSHLFVYLSMTESGFQVNAKSSKQAAGLWQFMSATAQQYGLRVDKHMDQRYDPMASTNAAMKYIRALYKRFGKWYLVMMAYNSGGGRIARAIKKAGSDNFETLMSKKHKYIPFETRRYLQKIILLSMMGEHIVKSDKKEDKKIELKIIDGKIFVNVYGGTNLIHFVDMLHIKLNQFFDMNPQLRDYKVPESIFIIQVKIPVENYPYYKAQYSPPTIAQIFKAKHYNKLIAYVIKGNDSVKSIARKYSVTPIDLIITNQLSSNKLKNGSILMIPVSR